MNSHANALDVPMKKLHPDAVLPTRAHDTDACYDVVAVEETTIEPGSVGKVRLGFALALPEGWEAQLRPRSGLCSKGIIGMFGYVLRFYSMSRLDVFWYAMLSNFGIFMSYVYGYVLNGEVVHPNQLVGSLLVIFACMASKLI